MPSPSDRTETSAATPMMIPSVERSVRSGFARSVSKPTRSDEAAIRSNMSLDGVGDERFSTYGRPRPRFQQGARAWDRESGPGMGPQSNSDMGPRVRLGLGTAVRTANTDYADFTD